MNIRKRLERLESALPPPPGPATTLTGEQLRQLTEDELLRLICQGQGGGGPAQHRDYAHLARLPDEELGRFYAEMSNEELGRLFAKMIGRPDLADEAPRP